MVGSGWIMEDTHNQRLDDDDDGHNHKVHEASEVRVRMMIGRELGALLGSNSFVEIFGLSFPPSLRPNIEWRESSRQTISSVLNSAVQKSTSLWREPSRTSHGVHRRCRRSPVARRRSQNFRPSATPPSKISTLRSSYDE